MNGRRKPLRETPLLLAIALSSQLPEPSIAQPVAQSGEQSATADPTTAADDDEPPPSMALLEFVALFETTDGQWMDPEAIPMSLEPDSPQTREIDTPLEQPDRTERTPEPPAVLDQRHAR